MFLYLKGEDEPISLEIFPTIVEESDNFMRKWEASITEMGQLFPFSL